MEETGQTPETPSGELKNNASTPAAPVTDNGGNNAEVERLRKEAEQARMRANQLENELAKKAEADREAQRKQLEEKEEFRTLYEQERLERERLQKEHEEAQTLSERTTAQTDILKDYAPEVVELAETTGLKLTGTAEADRALFKSKLDAIAEKVRPGKVAGNNPATPTKAETDKQQLLDGMKVGWKPAAGEYISNLDAIKQMRKQAGMAE